MSAEHEAKRARMGSPIPDLPIEDCTRFNFFQQTNLTDRQLLSWALKTETKVRFDKVQSRDTISNVSTSLDSQYLIELYPKLNEETKDTLAVVTDIMLKRDLHAFHRKSHSVLLERDTHPDASFNSLIQIQFPGHVMAENALPTNLTKSLLVVPPNLLYFEIILEAFMGYKISRYHSPDPAMPRAAVMGGAIVAVLTAWRDKRVVRMFAHELRRLMPLLLGNDSEQYKERKGSFLKRLHSHFLHQESSSISVFSTGDVDIFLQASPLTRAAVLKLALEFPTEVMEHIFELLGGCGFVQGDLQRFASSVCTGLVPTATFESVEKVTNSRTYDFCYALAKNGLSFIQTIEKLDRYDDSNSRYERGDPWYRTSQMIMLNERADLVGGLLDFDLSIATCAYDGLGVKVTPRAAFSLATMTQVVTPFCLEEKRNRKRIVKYFKRGFSAYLIDPCCVHESLCANGVDTVLRRYRHEDAGLQTTISPVWVEDAPWMSSDMRTEEEYDRICEQQEQSGEPGSYVCHSFRHSPYRACSYRYSVALFEKEEGHAIRYFARRFRWSDEDWRRVEAVPATQRFACSKCRREYALQLVMEKSHFPHPETAEDVLQGDSSYRHSVGHCGDLDPSFYSGPAFSSILVAYNARSTIEMLSVLRGQHIAEEARYILRNGTLEGYKKRFTFSNDLHEVFEEAGKLAFPNGARNPVGLNPERFIAKCEDCNDWLHGCEFGTNCCESCSQKKPAPSAKVP